MKEIMDNGPVQGKANLFYEQMAIFCSQVIV